MGLYTVLPESLHEVDIIIAGGGTSGSVIASRVSDAYPSLSILIVEGGPDNYNNPDISIPGLYRFNLHPTDSNTSITWNSGHEEQLANRSIGVATGAVLGGSSSINALAYARGQAVEFDAWNAEGWSAQELLPLLKRLETYHGDDESDTHGHDGPIQASDGHYVGKSLRDDFIEAAKSAGYDEINDVHNLAATNAVAPNLRYASPQDGKRQDAASRYLHPRLRDGKHPNLNVLVGAQVSRVLLGPSNEATSIEYRYNPKLQSGESSQGPHLHEIKARKLVVVSAGAFGTPLILERSGIGDPSVLDRAGINSILNLPGVGRNYQDHQVAPCVYYSKERGLDTVDSLFNGLRDLKQLVEADDPMLTWNGIDAMAKIRPSAAEVTALGEGYQATWDRGFADTPTKPLFIIALVNGILANPSLMAADKSFFTLCPYLVHEESRGHVHITGPSIDDAMDFRTGFLSDAADFDLSSHVWAYKRQRAIARRMRLFDGELASQHPEFAAGSGAAIAGDGDMDGDRDGGRATDITYSVDDDTAIRAFLRTKVGTTWHALGTCRMGPAGEDGGVVAASLDVHGAARLKVADMSVAPGNVAANTMNTALLIGEKAADIIVAELAGDV
ncbi:alcohol oxidase [Xylariaceae sp. FL0804]|nr:alcohol oxidase [Xylariaceae sp. FL0804]